MNPALSHWHTCRECRRRYECRCNRDLALYGECDRCAGLLLHAAPGDEIAAHAMGVRIEVRA